MPYKIAFVSLGCAKNLVNTEQMMALCRRAGHTVTGDPDGADVAVLNTCGFIESAKSEAIENILELAELKKVGRLKKLLVTGCLSQRYPDDIRTELPEVDGMLGTGSYTDVAAAVEELMAGEKAEHFGNIHRTFEDGERLRKILPEHCHTTVRSSLHTLYPSQQKTRKYFLLLSPAHSSQMHQWHSHYGLHLHKPTGGSPPSAPATSPVPVPLSNGPHALFPGTGTASLPWQAGHFPADNFLYYSVSTW